MNNVKAQLSKSSEESIEATREVLKTSLASIEKLTKLNLDASKKFLAETTKALKEISGIKNPKDLFEKVNQLATHTVENNISNCRDVYDIISDTHSRIRKMVESHLQSAQKSLNSAADNFSKLNPGAKSPFSADAIKKWFEGTNEAMETLNKITANASKGFTKTSPAKTAATANKPATAKPAAKARPAARTKTNAKKKP
jgi:phasin family protein